MNRSAHMKLIPISRPKFRNQSNIAPYYRFVVNHSEIPPDSFEKQSPACLVYNVQNPGKPKGDIFPAGTEPGRFGAIFSIIFPKWGKRDDGNSHKVEFYRSGDQN